MKGAEVRNLILSKRVRIWEVAEKMGYNEDYFSRKLRHDFTADEVEKVKTAISEILGA